MHNRITVLMYHRISTPDTDPWDICVSPENFAQQVQYFTENYTIITAEEAVEQVAAKHIKASSLCLTFDDGYADNYENAKPVLEKYNCPAMFFIPSYFVSQQASFWWDALEIWLLHTVQLPDHFAHNIAGKLIQCTLDAAPLSEDQWQQHCRWKWYEQPPTARCHLFLQLWEALRQMRYGDIIPYMAVIQEWAAPQTPTAARLPMNEQQLQSLFSNKLFTPGIHTHTHPYLQSLPKHQQLAELQTCKEYLSKITNTRQTLLAYPYGNYNSHSIEVAQQLQIDGCFTTQQNQVTAFSSIHHLGRYQAVNKNAQELIRQFSL